MPRRAIDHLLLDTRRATAVYWVSVSLVVAGLFVPRLLPCVDYPQHLALSDVARRLVDGDAPERAAYRLNYFTYNGAFHAAVACLSRHVPIELAGRVVVGLSLAAAAGGVLALLRVTRRPSIHAALFTPVLFSFSLGWGFINYVLATTIALWALVLVARVSVRPAAWPVVGIAVLGLACGFAHVLGLLILCTAALPLAVEMAFCTTPGGGPARQRLARVARRSSAALLPLGIGCVYCLMVFHVQYAWDPRLYRDPVFEGTGPPAWRKFERFGVYALDLFTDGTDRAYLWGAIALMVAAVWLARRHRSAPGRGQAGPPIVSPLVVLAAAYAATPTVLVGTHFVFERLAQWVVLGAILAVPALPPATAPRMHRGILALALASGANVALHCALYARETDDASRVIDDLPPRRSATAIVWDPGTYAFRKGALTHLAAYYAARKEGQWAFSFARYLSVPVRFRAGAQPPWPAHGWEFNAGAYDPRCRYARAFPLVIVRAPATIAEDASGEGPLRRLVFRQDADAVKLLSHHGRYWAFDTTGLPDDGTS